MRIDELSMQQNERPSTINQLLSQNQELQDEANYSMNGEKEVYDPETASRSGMSHVPSQPLSIPSPRGMISRDPCLPHDTRNAMGTSGNVFEDLPAQAEPTPQDFGIIFLRIEIR